MTDDEAYVRLGTLLAAAPAPENLNSTEYSVLLRWIGQALALAEARGSLIDAATLRNALSRVTMGHLYDAYWSTVGTLNAMLASAELKASPAMSGSFIAAGQDFDALSAVAKAFATADQVVRLVDPYMDEKTLTHFAVLLPDHVRVELLTDSATMKPSLSPAVAAWVRQHVGVRALEARKSAPRMLHDRAIFLDGQSAYSVSQSFNALAGRSPATLSRLDAETAALKMAAYDNIWANSQSI